ncbi:MAG: helix-turn-helix transcriptional regulator [Solidesulfovibrio sp.]|uniref:PadR family transcriptional regulator n=1 Tax=Solidesulfovibrio sp. TaxID=2910990 RepID=UPI002B219C73|nr:helix-turn-helix transcriptional regulator [Solidesulfovibrio sp.]MEA4856368.1 helix-turn-helix transcriptional regulator [Solidesulfovibrio sp.]
MEFIDCPCTGKSLIRLVRPAVLTVLAGEPLHGYEVLRRIAPLRLFRGHPPDAAGVYRALRDMEAEGLLHGNWDLPEQGPAKRRFALTARGLACLAKWEDTLSEHRAALEELLTAARGALAPAGDREAS